MSNRYPLQDEQVIFTGIPRSAEAGELISQLGGAAIIAPLISTREIVSPEDEKKLLECNRYDWFIFTSQSGVQAFHEKMKRYNVDSSFFRAKIAVVGSKTATAMEEIGFTVDFVPNTFSADVFVQEFPSVISSEDNCLFIRGNLAKTTISDGLVNLVNIWTIYETVELEENIEQVKKTLKGGHNCSIIFTSPSTVEAFHHRIGKDTGYDRFTICAIGHITKNYLNSLGVTVHVMPDTYTLIEVIYKLAEWKGRKI